MNELKVLYDTNEVFRLYVDKFALCYHLDAEEALQYSIVQSVSECYAPNKVG